MKMKRIINLLIFLIVTYPCGILLGIVFQFLRLFKIVRILHWERFPHWQKKLILVSNHPSLLEPLLLPALFFKEYLFGFFKYSPWCTPDKKNFYDPWYCFWLRPLAIPIDRGNERAELQSLFQMKEVLNSGKRIILFPEGGRTFIGEIKEESFFYSREGKKIRILKGGIGWLALKTGAMVLPVWVEGTDKVLPNIRDKRFPWFNFKEEIVIKIGEPLIFQNSPVIIEREQITQMIANKLLELADEEE